ncbi:hypothetical protein BH24CHL7_BH24CHL7_14650 [soil metagenome]
MTPEARALAALDAFRDAFAELLTAGREPSEPPALLTLTGAAAALGVSRSTVTRWADDGRLRTIGGPKARRVPRAEVARLAGDDVERGA